MQVRGLNCLDMLDFIKTTAGEGEATLRFVFNHTGFRYIILKVHNDDVSDAVSGELNTKIIAELKRLLSKNQLSGFGTTDTLPKIGQPVAPLVNVSADRPRTVLTLSALSAFYKDWDTLTKANRAEIPKGVRNAVIARAGGCCEFRNCAENLFERDSHFGYFGYLAHIVGAVKEGPRGDYALPVARRNDADNILLLCDFHHRLIDRIDPDRHDVPTLRNMLEESVRDRRGYQQFRRLPETRPLAFLSDIMGVTTDIDRGEIIAAMCQRGLRPDTSEITQRYFGDKTGGVDLDVPTYWPHFLSTCRNEIAALIHACRGDGEYGANGKRIAVFALGNIPALVLGGRIVGEARPIELFHRDRTRGSWSWSEEAEPPNRSSYSYSLGENLQPQETLVLKVAVTAPIEQRRLAEDIQHLPVIEVSTERQNQNPFSTNVELEWFRETVQQALNFAQDRLRAKVIYLVIVAPASCAFAVGMKLQARNHSKIVVHQVVREGKCFPALIIGNSMVRDAKLTVEVPLN